jgi:hypothetical protein
MTGALDRHVLAILFGDAGTQRVCGTGLALA